MTPDSEQNERKDDRPAWEGEPARSEAENDWHSPSKGVRVVLVALIFAIAGTLLGLMFCLVIPLTRNPLLAGGVGALLGTIVGAWLESTE